MNEMMTGAIAMGFAVAAVFFLKFWRQSRDRLFAFFALSFIILAANRALIVIVSNHDDSRGSLLYWVRLAAFMLILIGVLDKNRTRQKRPS